MTKNFELTGKQQKEKKNWKNTITEAQETWNSLKLMIQSAYKIIALRGGIDMDG